jgi:hypothetical protein
VQGRFRIRLVHFWYNALVCRRRHDFWQAPAPRRTHVREKSAGIVKATVSDHGRTGSATFEDVTLGRYGSKEGTVSGSISWECASVQRL